MTDVLQSAYGTRIVVDDRQWSILKSVFSPRRVYANSDTNVWALGGNGIWLELTAQQGGYYKANTAHVWV